MSSSSSNSTSSKGVRKETDFLAESIAKGKKKAGTRGGALPSHIRADGRAVFRQDTPSASSRVAKYRVQAKAAGQEREWERTRAAEAAAHSAARAAEVAPSSSSSSSSKAVVPAWRQFK